MRKAMKSLGNLTVCLTVVGLVLGVISEAQAQPPIIISESQLKAVVVHGSQLESKLQGSNSRHVFSFRLPAGMSAEDVRVVFLRIKANCEGGIRGGILRGQAFCNVQAEKTSNLISDILGVSSLSDTLASQNDSCDNGAFYLGVADEVRCAYQEGQSSLIIAIEGVGNIHPRTDDVILEFHNNAYPAGSKFVVSPYGQ